MGVGTYVGQCANVVDCACFLMLYCAVYHESTPHTLHFSNTHIHTWHICGNVLYFQHEYMHFYVQQKANSSEWTRPDTPTSRRRRLTVGRTSSPLMNKRRGSLIGDEMKALIEEANNKKDNDRKGGEKAEKEKTKLSRKVF